MGFTFTVTTDTTGGVAVTFKDGRLTDAEGRPIFTDRVFADVIEADYWLHFCDDFARFMGAYIGGDVTRRGYVEYDV
jgi:hypothetical protein